MRRTIFLNGGNFRLPEIIGSTHNEDPFITPWSVQAGMISNLKRLAFGLRSGAPRGRVIGGGEMTVAAGGGSVTVSPLVGVTKGNEFVWIQKPLTIPIPDTGVNSYDVWAKYNLIPVPDDKDYGNVVNSVGSPLNKSQQIVYDESGAGNADISPEDILSIGEPDEDAVYIGEAIVSPSEGVLLNPDTGFPNTDIDGYQIISKIISDSAKLTEIICDNITVNGSLITDSAAPSVFNGNATFNNDVDFATDSVVKVEGSNAYSGSESFIDDTGKTVTLTFSKGLCTGFTVI